MTEYKVGQILKLSREGLDFLYQYDPKRRKRAREWRFEYRCRTRRYIDCLSVLKLPQKYYQSFHKGFLEPVKGSTFWQALKEKLGVK